MTEVALKPSVENLNIVRPVLLKAVVGLEAFGALGGLAGGTVFLLDPTGSLLGMSTSALAGAPVQDFFPVGLWLAGIFGVGGLLVAYSVWSARNIAGPLAYLLGVAAVGWIIEETLLFGPSLFLAMMQFAFCGPQIVSAIFLLVQRRP